MQNQNTEILTNFRQSSKLYFEVFLNLFSDYEYNDKKLNLSPSERSLKKKLKRFQIFQIFYWFVVHVVLHFFMNYSLILRFLLWAMVIPFFHLIFRHENLNGLLCKMKRN